MCDLFDHLLLRIRSDSAGQKYRSSAGDPQKGRNP